MIRLYDYELSADCYAVRLLLACLGLACERVPIDFYPGREQDSLWFRAISPAGALPVLEEDGVVLEEPGAILVYLATRHDPSGRWHPHAEPVAAARVACWLAMAVRLGASVGRARLQDTMFLPGDPEPLRAEAHRLFRSMDEHLWFAEQEGHPWLCPGPHPTIADLACFPQVMLSEEGGVSRLAYPALRRWGERVKRIPGFTVMPGVLDAGAAALP